MNNYLRDFRSDKVKSTIIKNFNEYTSFLDKNSSIFSVYHTNIRSLEEHITELQVYLTALKNNFEIIILTETFVLDDTSLLNNPGYKFIYNDGKVSSHDGTVIYVKDNLQYEFNIDSLDNIKIINLLIKQKK